MYVHSVREGKQENQHFFFLIPIARTTFIEDLRKEEIESHNWKKHKV